MARARRVRPSIARTHQVAKVQDHAVGRYRQSRASVAVLIFMFVFGLAWLINGEFTAEFVVQLTGRPASWGWSTHLVITVIEIAPPILAPYLKGIPRRIILVLWLLSMPFGIFDVLSSAVGVSTWLGWTGATGVLAHVQNVVAAEIIGFLPERMLLYLAVVLRNVIRG